MSAPRRRGASPARSRGVTPNPDVELDSLPALQAFFRAYLHEDFPAEHGSAVAAASAFRRDASPAEREALAQEAAVLLDRLRGMRLAVLRAFVVRRLGGAWRPPSVRALSALLHQLRDDRE